MHARTLLSLVTTLGLAASAAGAQTVTTVHVHVPGTSDPWLAGMPPGSTASVTDVAPAQSPAQVLGIDYALGGYLTFSGTGVVSHPYDDAGPEGAVLSLTPHDNGAQNGISNVLAPFNSLIGVFLGPSLPTAAPAPAMLLFDTPALRDYATLAPLLQQTFYVGDGLTSGGVVQHVLVPSGATRLYLGPMDGVEWVNNGGAFDITVTAVQATATPEPATLVLLGVGLVPLGAAARRRRAA